MEHPLPQAAEISQVVAPCLFSVVQDGHADDPSLYFVLWSAAFWVCYRNEDGVDLVLQGAPRDPRRDSSGSITLWQIDGKTVTDYFGGLQNHCRW